MTASGSSWWGSCGPGEREPELREIAQRAAADAPAVRAPDARGRRRGLLRGGRLGVRPLPPDHRAGRRLPGDRAGVDAAAPRPADQDRSAGCREAGPAVPRRRADGDPRPRRSGGRRSGICCGAGRRSAGTCCGGGIASSSSWIATAAAIVAGKNWTPAPLDLAPRSSSSTLPALQRTLQSHPVRPRAGAGPPGRTGQGDRGAGRSSAPYREPVGWLRCFRGIDTLSAMILLAEIVDFQRFQRPRELMAYLGLVPERVFVGGRERRGAHHQGRQHPCPPGARRGGLALPPSPDARPRAGGCGAQGQPAAVVSHAWRAQQRLHRRYRHLVGHGKRPPVAVAAVARELVGFLWAAMTQRARGGVGRRPRGLRDMRFLSGVDAGSMRARLESPRPSYATPGPRIGTTRAPRRRQLPTNHGHAALPLGNPRISA